MNMYNIHAADGRAVGTVHAITPGAALIQWSLLFGRVFPGVTARRERSIADEVVELAGDTAALNWCRAQYSMGAKAAYRTAHHFAREQVSQRYDRFSDPMGDWHGRNI